MSTDTSVEPTIDLEAEVEVIAVSTFGDYLCIMQGEHFFSVKVGDPDEPAEYTPITAQEAEEIRALCQRSTRPGTAESLDAVRRSIAPGRDYLLEVWYEIDPESRAVRDYLRLHHLQVSNEIAEEKLGKEEFTKLKAEEERLIGSIDWLDRSWPSDGWEGAADAAAAHASQLRPLEQELAEIHEKLGRHRPDIARYYPKGTCHCGARLKQK